MTRAADWRLVVAAGGAAGLALSPFWHPGGGWVRPGLLVILACLLLIDRGRLGRTALVLIALAAATAGLMVGAARLDAIEGGALSGPAGETTLSGYALEPPSDSRGTARFDLETAQGRVRVETDSGNADGILPGTGLEVSGTLGPAPDWQRKELARRGISMVLRADRVAPAGSARGGLPGIVDRLRDRAFAALAVAVPERETALSRGFVLGDDSDIDPRTTEDFRRSGLSHLLAVSGQNVILLALLAAPFLALLGVGPRARLAAIAALIVIYVPLAGGGPSIQRAGIMGLAGLAAAAASRAASRTYALALAALLTLALNPRASADIGWQLSFAAVVGIMLLARPLQARIAPWLGERRWHRALSEGAAITLAATIATAPLLAFHFERLPVATVAANLAAMPAVAPAMWMGMISIGVGQVSAELAAPFNLAGSLFLGWIARVAEWFGRPGWAVAETPGLSVPALIGVSLLLAGAVFLALRLWPASRPVFRRRRLPVLAAVLLLVVLLLPYLGESRRELSSPGPEGIRVEVFDVGQGDAILIRPPGSDPILIDGGPPGGDLPGALASAGVGRLAAAVLTHPDLDHYGGLLDILGLLPVDRLLFDSAPPELIALARSSGVTVRRVAAGEWLRTDELKLEILWPPERTGALPATAESETNARSLVVLLHWRDFRMLLTGDAEAESVPLDPGPIDVLKVAHHGSEDDGLPGLLARTSPRMAVISVGEKNRFGHPVAAVLKALDAAGVRTLRTDRDGTVSMVLSGSGRVGIETGR